MRRKCISAGLEKGEGNVGWRRSGDGGGGQEEARERRAPPGGRASDSRRGEPLELREKKERRDIHSSQATGFANGVISTTGPGSLSLRPFVLRPCSSFEKQEKTQNTMHWWVPALVVPWPGPWQGDAPQGSRGGYRFGHGLASSLIWEGYPVHSGRNRYPQRKTTYCYYCITTHQEGGALPSGALLSCKRENPMYRTGYRTYIS